MKILYATQDSYPFLVGSENSYASYSFPREIIKNEDMDIRVIMPKYSCISEKYTSQFKKMGTGEIQLAWRKINFDIEFFEYNGIKYYFISNGYYFQEKSLDYCEKIAFFSKAVLKAIEIIKFSPNIIQCNSLISSLIPLYLSLEEKNIKRKKDKIKTIFVIENMTDMGIEKKEVLEDVLGIPLEEYSKDEALGFYNSISLLKAGILYSNISVVTEGEEYLKEKLKEENSETLVGFFKYYKSKIYGIKNGISTEIFDPKKDENIVENYTYATLSKREINKLKLQEELKLKIDIEIPLIAIIGKLNEGNGIEKIKYIFDDILSEIVEVVIIGDGEEKYQDFFDYYSRIFSDKVYSVGVNFKDDTLVRKLLSGGDIILLPVSEKKSDFTKIIGQKYGIIPVTGNTEITLESTQKFLEKIKENINAFRSNKIGWQEEIASNMRKRNDWKSTVKKYTELYKNLI